MRGDGKKGKSECSLNGLFRMNGTHTFACVEFLFVGGVRVHIVEKIQHDLCVIPGKPNQHVQLVVLIYPLMQFKLEYHAATQFAVIHCFPYKCIT